MAENDERETHHEIQPEITSVEKTSVDEDQLELTLGLRPINATNPNPNAEVSLSKRDAQAFRRKEAKKKRDLKRKPRNAGDSSEDDAGVCRKSAKRNASYEGQNGKLAYGIQKGDGENRQSVSSGSSGISDNYQSNSGPGVTTSSDVGDSPTAHIQSPGIAKAERGKPPKPIGPTNRQQKVTVAQMPCVSVTGNGPDGKTITGFLYQYTKAVEISIVCVCHGALFTPAGFVEHAGGVDVEHPLKHIRVVPFFSRLN